MDYFGIQFDKNQFTPGEAVSGQVVLRSAEAINARYMKICIHGAAHTKWSESEHRHRKCDGESYTEIVNYSAETNYVSGEIIAWSASNGKISLPSGHHVFPFSFPLPVDCPPSFEGFDGHIRYSIRVELDRPWKFNKKEREYFKVIPIFDLNYLSCGNMAISMKDSKDIGAIFRKGIVTITVTIPKQAYTPGEYLPITVDIDNTSKRPALCVRAEIYQHSHYKGTRNAGLFCTHNSYHEHQKSDKKRVMESRKNIKVAPKGQGREELRMKIPKLAPTFQCPIISVDYCLSVLVDCETSLNGTLHCEIPLILGTVPINDSTVEIAPVISSAIQFPITNSGEPFVPVFPSRPTSSSISVVPSAPQESSELMPPAYTPSTMGAPPSYEESMSVTKI